MARTVAVLAALVIGGLAAFAGPAAASPARSPAQPPPDVAPCFDGTCTVTVGGPVEIPLDGRAGFTAISVLDVSAFAVTFTVRRSAGLAYGAVGRGGTARYGAGNGTLAVHVLDLTPGTARLEITTTQP